MIDTLYFTSSYIKELLYIFCNYRSLHLCSSVFPYIDICPCFCSGENSFIFFYIYFCFSGGNLPYPTAAQADESSFRGIFLV